MIILGIDPGYATVGFGVIESFGGNKMRPLEYGVVTTPKEDSLPKRLKQIADSFAYLIEKYKPDAVAIEELFFQNNQGADYSIVTSGSPSSFLSEAPASPVPCAPLGFAF